ncbi:MAG: glycosyltransferase [Thermoleophilia bacterium]|nr:glycosyltransferase [Thermoleophilia bacterium]
MRVLFLQRQPCIRALKCASALRTVAPDVRLAFAAQGQTLTEFYGSGDELFERWFRMDDPAAELRQAIEAYRPDVIHSHNLPDSLTVMALDIAGGRIPVVHDVHDMQSLRSTPYEDGFPDPTDPAEMERRASQECDALITVSDEVLTQLEARYALPEITRVLPNAPLERDIPRHIPPADRRAADPPRVVYQGSLSDNGSHYDLRGIFEDVAASGADLAIRPARPHAEYAELARRIGARYYEPVPPAQLMRELPSEDWGWAGFNDGLNRAHIDTALPNKAFEYLGAGLPILTLPHAALARFVRDNGVGLVLDDPSQAAAAARDADLGALRARVAEARFAFTAENNARRLVEVYGDLVGSPRAVTAGA